MTRIEDLEATLNLQRYQIADLVVDPLQLEILLNSGRMYYLTKTPHRSFMLSHTSTSPPGYS